MIISQLSMTISLAKSSIHNILQTSYKVDAKSLDVSKKGTNLAKSRGKIGNIP